MMGHVWITGNCIFEALLVGLINAVGCLDILIDKDRLVELVKLGEFSSYCLG